MKVKPIGWDLAKNVFALFGVDENEQPVLRKTVRRSKRLETFVLHRRHGSLQRRSSLSASAALAWARAAPDGAAVRQPLSQERQQRPQ